jgi:hypothetical protein
MLYFNEDDALIIGIDYSWSTDHSMGLRGYILGKNGEKVEEMTIESAGVSAPVMARFERPELDIPDHPSSGTSPGFWVELPTLKEHDVVIRAHVEGAEHVRAITFQQSSKPKAPPYTADSGPVWDDFIRRVNDEGLSVLEIGSRDVSPGGASKRKHFPRAASYTGFDYYRDENTDVVGDAHRLSEYFKGKKFDAIFSFATLEHLAMPWVLPLEINKLLTPGGITMHFTHQTWPVHELPWDFFRFSDNALRVLFSRELGFETITAGMFAPVRIHFDDPAPSQEALPSNPAFGGSYILTKKVADLRQRRFKWNLSLDQLAEDVAGEYPLVEKSTVTDKPVTDKGATEDSAPA